MSKATKSNTKPPQRRGDLESLQPLRGIQKVAWWSVPAVGVLALGCAATLGVLYVNRPTKVAANPQAVQSAASATTKPQVAKASFEPVAEIERETTAEHETAAKPESVSMLPAETAEPEQKIGEPIPFAKVPAETAAIETIDEPPKPKVIQPVSIDAQPIVSLTCADGKISYQGTTELTFVETQPVLETIEASGLKFAFLVFDGVESSAELSSIPRSEGSIEIVTRMPDRKTSVILDTNFQRLTLRKNRDGLRWRVGGKKKPDKIRLIPEPVDFNQWHHIMITWKDGQDAIIYVDGRERDRYPYIHEQPHFGEFQNVVLGRTRGPNGRFYESRVNKMVVYDQSIGADQVSQLDRAVRQAYPFVFQQP